MGTGALRPRKWPIAAYIWVVAFLIQSLFQTPVAGRSLQQLLFPSDNTTLPINGPLPPGLVFSGPGVTPDPTLRQIILPPSQFDDATQFGIGNGASPYHEYVGLAGYNLTDGHLFVQVYKKNATGGFEEDYLFHAPDAMDGFDTTEMNPVGVLINAEGTAMVVSATTINDSLIAYGYVYVLHRATSSLPFTLVQRLTDPLGSTGRMYGGALAGTAPLDVFYVGATVFPVAPTNTIPSTVETWTSNGDGTFSLANVLAYVETREGLWGYSLAITEDKKWLAVGAWNNHSVFLYDATTSPAYTLVATLAPFGNITRFGYSITFSPDVKWLVVGVFQYPSPGFVGAVAVYSFNSMAGIWNPNMSALLSTNDTSVAPGQGASVSISNAFTRSTGATAYTSWTIAYGMPYYLAIGGISVWTYSAEQAWVEVLQPLTMMGTIYANPAIPSDLGWQFMANRMISYDGCDVLAGANGNVGLSAGFAALWVNVINDSTCLHLPPSTPPGARRRRPLLPLRKSPRKQL